MASPKIALLIVIAFSAVTVLADIFIKRAADRQQMLSFDFALGAVLYALSAVGWFYALQSMKLSTLGGVYSLTTVVLVVISGIVFFGESLTIVEYAVIIVAVAAIVALWRFL